MTLHENIPMLCFPTIYVIFILAELNSLLTYCILGTKGRTEHLFIECRSSLVFRTTTIKYSDKIQRFKAATAVSNYISFHCQR
jgi:hypothetical protein